MEVSAADGPKTTTITVTAEDETVKTYTVTFTVADYAPVDALKLTAADWRGGEANLKQVTTSELVAFTVRSGKETLDEKGAVVTRPYDPANIEWFVNGKQQEGASGGEFDYIPQKYGIHEIHARLGKVDSNKITVAFTKGAPKPEVVILAEDFSRHPVGKPVPLSDDPAANLFSATHPNISTEGKLGEQGMRVVALADIPTAEDLLAPTTAVPSGRAAAWTTPDPAAWTGLQKNYPHSATEPIAVTFKTRIDCPEPIPAHPVSFHILGGAATAAQTHAVFSFNHTRTWGAHKPDAIWKPGWNPDGRKWMSVAYVFDPSRRRPENPDVMLYDAVFVGNENYLGKTYDDRRSGAEFMDHPGFGGRHFNQFNGDREAALVLSFNGGPRDLSNLGKATTYLADVKIYRPGSWIMTPAKPAFAAGEPVRMNFTHHANINTIKPECVKVTDSKGATVAVETIKTDPMNFDFFEMTFANGALKKGETYKVALDETVRDILDKTVYDAATFKVQ